MNTPDRGDRTESRDSVLCEFTDPAVDFTPRPARAETLRHAPSWLRERAAPSPGDPAALAACLLAQARVLLALGQHTEAVSAVTEAQQLYETVGMTAALADCYHLSAELHEALGRPNEALEFLRREAELRRRLSA
jgi:tetratricopeptide (TPR) repeat protein